MFKKSDLAPLFLIWLVGVLINWSGLVAPEFWWTDETRHAMNGVFFFDFFRDMPLKAPYDYVQRYFAQYPALAFNWYPPFFSIVLGAAMELFGVSEMTAHATVLVFWLVGLMAWYAWVVNSWGRPIALASSLVLIVVPELVQWSRSVMLDVPALAMGLISVLFFERYLVEPSHRRSILVGLTLSAALLLKQSILFLLPALLVYTFVTDRWRNAFWRREAFWGVGMVAIALALLTIHAIKFGTMGLAGTLGGLLEKTGIAPPLWSWGRWIMYGKALYATTGPILSGATLLGLVLYLCRSKQPASYLLLAWFLAWYVVDTIIFGSPGDSYRYTIYAMPVVAFFASYGLVYFPTQSILFRAWAGLMTIWILWQAITLMQRPHYYVAGYQDAARVVSNLPNSGTILVAARNDGNFIFHLRTFDHDRKRVVLRADKLLVTMSVSKSFGVVSHAKETADIERLLQQNAVRWILIESRDLIGLQEFEMLQNLLKQPGFRLIAEIPIRTNRPIYDKMSIQIYENLGLSLPADGKVKLDFPYLGKSFDFQFDATKQEP